MFTEITNPMQNLRWLVENRPGAPGGLYIAVGFSFFLAFTVVRIVPIPAFFFEFLKLGGYANMTWGQRVMVFVAVPVG